MLGIILIHNCTFPKPSYKYIFFQEMVLFQALGSSQWTPSSSLGRRSQEEVKDLDDQELGEVRGGHDCPVILVMT